VSCPALNEIRTAVSRTRVLRSRYVELDEVTANKTAVNGDAQDQEAIEHLVHCVRAGVRSTLNDPDERAVSRWLTESFCSDGFESPRHECCRAACQVFSWLTLARACELHDLARLECRRTLLPHMPPKPPIVVGKLFGTRSQWLTH
jgi:hypothetical protein